MSSVVFKHRILIRLASVLLLSGWLSGCATVGPKPVQDLASSDQVLAELRADAASNRALAEPKAALTPDLVSSLMPNPQQDAASQRFDLSVDKVSIAQFYRGLVADTGYSVVLHPGVAGKISLELSNVTIAEVMGVMRDVHGLDSVLKGTVYQIYPDSHRSEIFQIDYLNVTRTGHSEMQVSAGKVSDSGGGGSSNSNDQSGNQNSQGGGNGTGVVGTMVNTDAEANFWQELEYTLTAMVTADPEGLVVVTPQVGIVMVRAVPEVLASVRSYLDLVQSNLDRQVILEAKILEVTLREGFQAGIDWHTFGDASGGTFAGDGVNPGSEHRAAGEFVFGKNASFFNPTGSGFTLSSAFGDFDAAISLLKTQGVVQVLSSPRIATVNNQKAVIKVGSDEFFVTDISTDTITAGSAINTVNSPELTPFFSGIALDVTPQISKEGQVVLHVHPTVSEVEEQLKVIGGDAVPLAASTIRESDSIVRALSGQIVVIGGLMQNSSKDDNARVPGLGRLPGIGHLFKQKVQSGTKSELVILLRPIVVGAQTQADYLRGSADRVQNLKDQLLGPG